MPTPRYRKNGPPIEIGNIITIGEPWVTHTPGLGHLTVTGESRNEPGRHAAVFFTNPGNARKVAAALLYWADASEQEARRVVAET